MWAHLVLNQLTVVKLWKAPLAGLKQSENQPNSFGDRWRAWAGSGVLRTNRRTPLDGTPCFRTKWTDATAQSGERHSPRLGHDPRRTDRRVCFNLSGLPPGKVQLTPSGSRCVRLLLGTRSASLRANDLAAICQRNEEKMHVKLDPSFVLTLIKKVKMCLAQFFVF